MVKAVPNVLGIVGFEHDAVALQGWDVNVIHGVVFQEEPVVAIFVSIPHHHFNHLFRTMIVAFVISSVSAVHQVVVDIDRTQVVVGTGNVYCDDFFVFDSDCLDVFVMQQVDVYFFPVVDGVPKVFANLVRVFHACNGKPF